MIKTDIKQRLRDFHLNTCNDAADHIQILETTNKNLHEHALNQAIRISELESMGKQEPIGRLTRRNGIVSFHTDKILAELPDEMILYASPLAPDNAIDAERYRDIRDVFAAGHVQQNMFFEIVRTICSVKNKTPELFDSAMDAAIDAMKAAK